VHVIPPVTSSRLAKPDVLNPLLTGLMEDLSIGPPAQSDRRWKGK